MGKMKGSYTGQGEGGMRGGQLRTEMESVFVEYLVRYIRAYEAEGIPIRYITIIRICGRALTPF